MNRSMAQDFYEVYRERLNKYCLEFHFEQPFIGLNEVIDLRIIIQIIRKIGQPKLLWEN